MSQNTRIANIERRFLLATVGCFLLTPVIGHGIAVVFGTISPASIEQLGANGVLAGFMAGFLFLIALHYNASLRPLFQWMRQHSGEQPIPEKLSRSLSHFSLDYWGIFLVYVLTIPQVYYWSGMTEAGKPMIELVSFTLMQLVTAVLIGLPAYLYSMDVLGRAISQTGFPRVQFGLKLRLMLLGGFVPLLTQAMIMLYYWRTTGVLTTDLLMVLGGTGIIIVTITLLSIKGMSQALRPVEKMLSAKGASSYADLAELKPMSMDEVGYLTQTLGQLFRKFNIQEAHKRAIVDTVAESIIAVDEDILIKSMNPAAEKLFGFSVSDVIDKRLSVLIPGIRSSADIKTHLQYEHELNGYHVTGKNLPLLVRFGEMNISGKRMFTCIVADISEKKAARARQQQAEARYRDLVETAHDLVWSIDPDGDWTYLNKASQIMYGHSPMDMLGRPFTEFSDPENLERDKQALESVFSGYELVQYETVHVDRSGCKHNISFNARAHTGDDGKVIRVSGTARDITKQKSIEKQLAYQAQHDSLTGLYNRGYFDEELDRLIARIARSGTTCSIFYIDLDQFKYINDTLGHAAGDRLLIEVTTLLEKYKRDGDLLARFGGDEFTMLLYNVMESENAMTAAEHIRKHFEAYKFYEEGKTFNITCSIGVSTIDNTSKSREESLSHADLACNIAKAQGRNQVHLYNPSDDAHITMAEDMGWAAIVREFLEQDRFMLAYQPIISVKDGQVYDYEVLLRMPFDDGRTIMPGGFMPAAERFGLIHAVDRWTVNRALMNLAQFRSHGKDIRFAINLSGRAFEDLKLLPMIRETLDQTGLDPSLITFEITETAAITNMSAAVVFIQSLKDIGCQFALDDFGTGFCSFNYLKNLPVDKLKIDGSFVKELGNTSVDQAMVHSMNQVAHALGKITIAESVEDAGTLKLLQELGVDYAQGHYIGRPNQEIRDANLVMLN